MRIEKTVTMATTYEEVETDTHIAMGVSDKVGHLESALPGASYNY